MTCYPVDLIFIAAGLGVLVGMAVAATLTPYVMRR